MKVLICDKTEKEYIEQMRLAGLTVDVRDDITPEELPNVLPAYEAMVVRSRTKVRQPLIDVCPNLKVIVRGGVGLDTIDFEYARSKGIAVMNTPLASSASVAELAIGYMFMLARSLYKASSTMKAEKWDKKSFEGDEIGGKILGLVGVGNIGRETAKRASALGMIVMAYDPYVKDIPGIKLVSLDELLAQSDYISLHLPLKMPEQSNAPTYHLMNESAFALMKSSAYLINTSRGAVVDERALYEALVQNRIAGAALGAAGAKAGKALGIGDMDTAMAGGPLGTSTRAMPARLPWRPCGVASKSLASRISPGCSTW